MIIAVAVVAAAVAATGAPAVVSAGSDLRDSQRLVTLAGLTQRSVSLSQSLADERDEISSYIAAGRPHGEGLSERRSSRVDRQIDEIGADAPAGLRADLKEIGSVRRKALTGKGTALDAHTSYSEAIAKLHDIVEELADRMPPRAGSGAHALADLDDAVEQAGATRGLLLAALATPKPAGGTSIDPVTGMPSTESSEPTAAERRRDALSAQAQQARVRERSALADFAAGAAKEARGSYDSTVTGPEANTAETYLAKLTDQPTLSDAELKYDHDKVGSALSARIDLMRGVESALAADRAREVSRLRDEDVTALEIRIALTGVCLLIAVGVTIAVSRSLTHPLATLRLGTARVAADPIIEEPVRYTGRNDEFAQVVRSVNTMHEHAVTLYERISTLEADRKHLIGRRQSMADERQALREQLDEVGAQLETARGSIHGTFVNLALRTLALVERQLAVIEGLEEREQDPDRLATLFKLDHLATVMRRHSENLLVLAGAEHGQPHPGAVPLVDVLRAAVSEIERYERVRIAALPPHAHIAGVYADDLSHLLAELLENATSFSPPDAQVEVSGWRLESGEVMLSVQDQGIGMSESRLESANTLLSESDPEDMFPRTHEAGDRADGGLGLGLYVVARLAARHGVGVRLSEQKQGGTAAAVVLPEAILSDPSAGLALPGAGTQALGGTALVSLPGSEAEANSNVLYGRATDDTATGPVTPDDEDTSSERRCPGEDHTQEPPAAGHDPLIAAAEEAIRAAEKNAAAESVAEESAAEESAAAEYAAEESAERTDAERTDAGAVSVGEPGGSGESGEAAAAEVGAEDATDVDAAPEAEADAGNPTTSDTSEVTSEDTSEAAGTFAGNAPASEPVTSETTREFQAPTPDETAETDETADPAALTDPAAPTERNAAATTGLHAPSPYDIGPDRHERARDTDTARSRGQEDEAGDGERPSADGPALASGLPLRTGKGLPKRTPRITEPAPVPEPRSGGVDAEELRRRLDGFHQGAKKGRRDVEAAIAEETGTVPRARRAPEDEGRARVDAKEEGANSRTEESAGTEAGIRTAQDTAPTGTTGNTGTTGGGEESSLPADQAERTRATAARTGEAEGDTAEEARS
ncbi:hypothetical protein B1H18_07430 [Streptomyces tsukubensis]|uniref:Signal transduction histidine-protein kinase/phosphatase MprB n=1 Tax=Streptomyces tsukubensis TaxID=83656 RepID=A0A1V4ABG5_9ACTN|nr:nitrate- and nitrite sensing domain-containing protein [Streptomyces tsukubensis]OON81191.1 hypothetical protein B1H18_07430 [Streptomyces tsukubensis]